MPDETPEVQVDIDVLGTILCFAGKVKVGPAYCEAVQIMSAVDPQRARGILKMLHDDYTPEQVAHIAQQLGVDPPEGGLMPPRVCLLCSEIAVRGKSRSSAWRGSVGAGQSVIEASVRRAMAGPSGSSPSRPAHLRSLPRESD